MFHGLYDKTTLNNAISMLYLLVVQMSIRPSDFRGQSLLHSDSKYFGQNGPFEPSPRSIGSKLECRGLMEGGPPNFPFQGDASSKTEPTFSPPPPIPLGISEPLMAVINPHI